MVNKYLNKKDTEVKIYLLKYLRLLRTTNEKHTVAINKLIGIAKYYGLQEDAMNSSLQYVDFKNDFSIENQDQRVDQLFVLLNLVLNGDLYDSSEFDFCNEMGVLLGFPSIKVSQIITEMRTGIKFELSELEIKSKIDDLLK